MLSKHTFRAGSVGANVLDGCILIAGVFQEELHTGNCTLVDRAEIVGQRFDLEPAPGVGREKTYANKTKNEETSDHLTVNIFLFHYDIFSLRLLPGQSDLARFDCLQLPWTNLTFCL